MKSTNVERPNLEQLKKQAKDLLKAWRKGDSAAVSRVANLGFEQHSPRLHLAQLTIARELGFSSWQQLKASVESHVSNREEAAKRLFQLAFIELWSPNQGSTIQKLLEQYPDIGQHSIWLATLLGESSIVEQTLLRNPERATQKGGPSDWEPLLYACFSWFLKHDESRKPGVRAAAQLLLEAGACPDTAFFNRDAVSGQLFPLSALYGAAGVCRDPEMTRILLDAGANVNDGETCYHAAEEPGCRCLELVLDRGVDEESLRQALFRKLDFEDLPGLQLILSHGADPNSRWIPGNSTPLHHAVNRWRDASTVRCLLDAGADPNLTNDDGVTPYTLARRLGRLDIAELLAANGANTILTQLDDLIALCAEGKRPNNMNEAKRLVAQATRSHLDVLGELAEAGNEIGVSALLDIGFDIHGGSSPNDEGRVLPTPLHKACWKGRSRVVELLLKRGARVDIEEVWYRSNPLGWVCHGSIHSKASEPNEYARCARLLFEHGAFRCSWEEDWWQEEHGSSPEVRAVIAEFAVD